MTSTLLVASQITLLHPDSPQFLCDFPKSHLHSPCHIAQQILCQSSFVADQLTNQMRSKEVWLLRVKFLFAAYMAHENHEAF